MNTTNTTNPDLPEPLLHTHPPAAQQAVTPGAATEDACPAEAGPAVPATREVATPAAVLTLAPQATPADIAESLLSQLGHVTASQVRDVLTKRLRRKRSKAADLEYFFEGMLANLKEPPPVQVTKPVNRYPPRYRHDDCLPNSSYEP